MLITTLIAIVKFVLWFMAFLFVALALIVAIDVALYFIRRLIEDAFD